MKKQRPQCVIVVLLITLFALLSGCITVVEHQPPQEGSPVLSHPVVNSFTAAPDSITEGQQSRLDWDVSGATNVTVHPVVGTVGPVSTVQVSPAATTTYTLTATNEAGTTTATVTVNVAAAVVEKADLIVTKVWLQGKTVYYTIVNQGKGKAAATRSYLYVNGHKESDDYVAPMEAGEERTENFTGYNYPYTLESSAFKSTESVTQYVVKVCVDEEYAVAEAIDDNNCGSTILGDLFVYSFVDNAHRVNWTTNSGTIMFPSPSTSSTGAAFTKNMALEDDRGYGSILATYPPPIDQGWIEGTFADFYTDSVSRAPMSRDIVVPMQAKFTAKVGFKKGAEETDGVWFLFGYLDATGRVAWAPGVFAAYDGALDSYEVDLSGLEGRKTRFLLRVEDKAGALYKENWAVWQDPKVTQSP